MNGEHARAFVRGVRREVSWFIATAAPRPRVCRATTSSLVSRLSSSHAPVVSPRRPLRAQTGDALSGEHPDASEGGDAAARAGASANKNVYDSLRRDIVSGRLPPGTHIAEFATGRRYGVSRTTVRLALQRLAGEELLTQVRGGARPRLAVTPLRALDAEELCDLCGVLEGRIARDLSSASPDVRRELAERIGRYMRALPQACRERPVSGRLATRVWKAARDAFVTTLGGAATMSLLSTFRARLERYECVYERVCPRDGTRTARRCADLLRALLAADGPGCERVLRRARRAEGKRLRRVLAAESSERPDEARGAHRAVDESAVRQ